MESLIHTFQLTSMVRMGQHAHTTYLTLAEALHLSHNFSSKIESSGVTVLLPRAHVLCHPLFLALCLWSEVAADVTGAMEEPTAALHLQPKA